MPTDSLETLLRDAEKEFELQGRDVQDYVMASSVILNTMGAEWWKKHALLDTNRADDFFRTSSNPEVSAEECRQLRIIKLGHCLYALRRAAGFEDFVRALLTRDVEPAFFELWAASILQDFGFTVRFVIPTGTKRSDYDLVLERDGVGICAEAKHRCPDEAPTGNALMNTLVKARRQLPEDEPGIVLLSIPSAWTWIEEFEAMVAESLEKFFRSSGRVNVVGLFWEHWVQTEAGRGEAFFWREYFHPQPRASIRLGSLATETKSTFSGLSFRKYADAQR